MLTLENVRDPDRVRAVLRRARQLRARNGVTLGRYSTYEEALRTVIADLTRRDERDRQIAAVLTLASVMGTLSIDPIRYRREYEERQAQVALRRRRPVGVSGSVWRELVDHFQGRCFTCPALATGVGHLEDGLPVPACPHHCSAFVARVVQGTST